MWHLILLYQFILSDTLVSEYPLKVSDVAKVLESYSKKASYNDISSDGISETMESKGYNYIATVSSQFTHGDFMPYLFSSSTSTQWSSKENYSNGKYKGRVITPVESSFRYDSHSIDFHDRIEIKGEFLQLIFPFHFSVVNYTISIHAIENFAKTRGPVEFYLLGNNCSSFNQTSMKDFTGKTPCFKMRENDKNPPWIILDHQTNLNWGLERKSFQIKNQKYMFNSFRIVFTTILNDQYCSLNEFLLVGSHDQKHFYEDAFNAHQYSVSPMNLLPDMISNHQNWISNDKTEVFPPIETYAYVSICGYKHLSLSHAGPHDCIVMSLSLLLTSPKYGFLLLIPINATLDEGYSKAITSLNIQLYRYTDFELPPYAIEHHSRKGEHGWIIAYQKIHILNLISYEKVLFLDCDQIVNKNLDHVFESQGDKIGNDCLPHLYPADYKTFLTDKSPMSSLVLVTPSKNKFAKALDLLSKGTEYFDNNGSKTPTRWVYHNGDQQLLPFVLENMTLFNCHYQSFPDVCLRTEHPLRVFPPSKFYVFHYTWWLKGAELSHDFYRGSKFQKVKNKYGWNETWHKYHMECMQIFAFSFEHYSNLLKLIVHNNITQVPISKLLHHHTVSFNKPNWIDL